VALRSNKTSSTSITLANVVGGRQQLKPPLSTAFSDVLHEGWKKLGLTSKAPRLVFKTFISLIDTP
jgi:hypothetical protein